MTVLMINRARIHLLLIAAYVSLFCTSTVQAQHADSKTAPRIVNIVNFIRLLEPRDAAITEDVLFQTVVSQVDLMRKYDLPGTFLLQYDALMDNRYQGLLKNLPEDRFEIGGWWELPQPLVEKAGLPWRGRYPWDWHANVGFASGYTPAEREKLVDVYMADFRKVFGRYPASVASWFIDAHTLQYMHDKYSLVASANCKDQVGTDGYTLWGGYWNQAYYPSKMNAYMPAQTEAGQIPVPIFRMLGSDPLRQYDTGIGHTHQGVISLEPVYGESGGSRAWVDWYFENFIKGECLAFNYVQAGQENSFTWAAMKHGLEYQFPVIAQLRDKGQLRVETLAHSGRWFRKKYRTTPATAVTFQSRLNDDPRQTIWFDSRFYRANLVWEDDQLWIRDVHLFEESIESPIYRKRVNKPAVEFSTLPLVDGYHWSSSEHQAGLRFVTVIDDSTMAIKGREPIVSQTPQGGLSVIWPLTNISGELRLTFSEDTLEVARAGSDSPWWIELTTADNTELPFAKLTDRSIAARFHGNEYQVMVTRGAFEARDRGFRIRPDDNRLKLDLSNPIAHADRE